MSGYNLQWTGDKDDRPDVEETEWVPPKFCPCGSGKLYRECHMPFPQRSK